MPYVYNPLLDAGLDQTGAGGGATGDITAVAAGTGLTGGGTTGDVTLSLANTAVSAGSYSYGSFTVDAQGRITAASNGGIGSTTQLLFNDAGSIGGDADLTWNKTTNVMTVAGDMNLSDGGAFTTTLQTTTPTANRTISLPDATGTVALVGGSSGQLLWNNAGANAGASTLTYDGSILTTSGRFINSYNATASSPAKALTGTWFTGGTATTTKPQVLIEPTGTTSTAWSTSGTGLGVNAASGFAGNLLDLQVNGSSLTRVNSNGTVIGTNFTTTATSGSYQILNRIGLSSSASGLLLLLDSAGTSFDRIQLGGTTSSFPALKRSSAILQARLADDSAYTTIDAQLRAQGTAPASTGATGTAGDIRYDADYIYVCTATNTWKRAALATW